MSNTCRKVFKPSSIDPCVYEQAEDFSEGLAAVERNGKWGYIDATGREIVPPGYDEVEPFSDGYAKVCRNTKWGIVAANFLILFIYSHLLNVSPALEMSFLHFSLNSSGVIVASGVAEGVATGVAVGVGLGVTIGVAAGV